MESFKKWFVIIVGYSATAYKFNLSNILTKGDSKIMSLLGTIVAYCVNYLFYLQIFLIR